METIFILLNYTVGNVHLLMDEGLKLMTGQDLSMKGIYHQSCSQVFC